MNVRTVSQNHCKRGKKPPSPPLDSKKMFVPVLIIVMELFTCNCKLIEKYKNVNSLIKLRKPPVHEGNGWACLTPYLTVAYCHHVCVWVTTTTNSESLLTYTHPRPPTPPPNHPHPHATQPHKTHSPTPIPPHPPISTPTPTLHCRHEKCFSTSSVNQHADVVNSKSQS